MLAAVAPIARDAAETDHTDAAGESDAEATASDRADALRAISQRLHREELRAFKSLGANWLSGGTDDLWLRADSIASALEQTRAG